MLTIKDADEGVRIRFKRNPPERNVELWTFAIELLDKFRDVLPYRSWINPLIVMDILNRKFGKKVFESA